MRKLILTEGQYKNVQKELIQERKNSNIVKQVARKERVFLNESQVRAFSKILKYDRENAYNFIFENEDILSILEDMCVLSFSTENLKLSGGLIFSLPAGWTCPFADKCLKKVNRYRDNESDKKSDGEDDTENKEKGNVVWKRGENAEFDCFAANQELQYDAVRAGRWRNFDLLKSAEKSGGVNGMYELMKKSLEYAFDEYGKKDEVRIHESGDFYNQNYLDAWVKVAKAFPNVVFYAYTKSYPYFKKYMVGQDAETSSLNLTNNFIITFSYGGKHDKAIENSNLKTSKVFNSPEDILKSGLNVDLDDDLAKVAGNRDSSFALLLHGTQKAGISSQMKMRNETFLNYWKYRPFLNRKFQKPINFVWKTEDAETYINSIKNELLNRKQNKGIKPKLNVKTADLEEILKQLNYVVKYNKYNFDNSLIEIIPNNYKP